MPFTQELEEQTFFTLGIERSRKFNDLGRNEEQTFLSAYNKKRASLLGHDSAKNETSTFRENPGVADRQIFPS